MRETLARLIDQTALRMDGKDAILFLRKGRLKSRVSYASLRQASGRVAAGLSEMGLKKGERAVLFMPKSLEQAILHLGLQRVGAISVILNPGLKKDEIEYFIGDSDPCLVVVGTEQEALIRSIERNRRILPINTDTPFVEEKFFPGLWPLVPDPGGNPDDPAVLIYTSGTTGQPKGAILTQQNLIQDAENIIQIWQIVKEDVLCHALPLFHVHGLCFALHTALIAGSKIVMCDEFSPDTVINILSSPEGELACTLFMGVPTMYLRMIEILEGTHRDFGHVRLFTSGSAPLLPKDFERIQKVFGKAPVEREGMSETGMNFSNPIDGMRKPGSVGIPLPHVEVRIVNPETHRDVDAGQVGEIWLKGPHVTPGYWRKPQETEAAFVGGWFRTGDLGRRDGDGYYTITDRLKDIIISGGENISPKEIEIVINHYEKVSESCVVGIPDERWGEKVVAAVVTKPGATLTEQEIKDHCKTHLMDWKCPKQILFLNELPRNRMGKVLKEEVIKLFVKAQRMPQG